MITRRQVAPTHLDPLETGAVFRKQSITFEARVYLRHTKERSVRDRFCVESLPPQHVHYAGANRSSCTLRGYSAAEFVDGGNPDTSLHTGGNVRVGASCIFSS